MRKNYIFLLAYIIFIFLCYFVHLFYAFPMWERIVAAVTSASLFFSIADMHRMTQKNYLIWIKDGQEYVSNNIEHTNRMIEYIKTCLKRDNNSETEEFLNSSLYHAEKLNNSLKNQLYSCDKEDKKNIDVIFEIVFSMLGFLVFFCILAFEPMADYAVRAQDSATVFSFGVIILTQFCGEWVNDNRRKRIEKLKNESDRIIKLENSFREEWLRYAN